MIRIIIGLAVSALGILAVIYTEWLINNIGYNEWAESGFSIYGGSRGLYKLIGVILIFGGLLYTFDMYEGFFKFIGKVFFGVK